MWRIKLETSGNERYNAFVMFERVHETLQQIYRKVIAEYRNQDPEYALSLNVRAMNVIAI